MYRGGFPGAGTAGSYTGTILAMNTQPGVPPLVLAGPPDGEAPLRLGRRVTLYVCGITPYDAAHIGHAFTYVAFDTLARFLRARGHEVTHLLGPGHREPHRLYDGSEVRGEELYLCGALVA